MVEREFHEGNEAAQKRRRNPAGVAKVMLLNHLEPLAGPIKVFADGTKSVAPTELGQIGKAGGKGSIVAAAIVAVLAGLCRLNRRPNFEGTDPGLVARLAELAMELSCPELARVLTCSADAARDGVRLAAQHTPMVIAGTRHAPARVRLGECFDRVVVYIQTVAPRHASAKPDASYFEPASYASILERKSKVRVYGHAEGTTAPVSTAGRTVSGSAKAPRRPTSEAVQRATVLTLGGPAPAHRQPLTLSGWCLAARSLGKAAMIAAALILDGERRDGEVWVDDDLAVPPGQKPETAKARRLLEGFLDRPRKLDVVTAARGLVALARAGLLRISGSTWYRVAPGEHPWALSPELALYGIEPAPSSEPMPTGPEVNDLVRWLRGVSPASEKQLSFLGKHGIDGAGMSSAEAAALQVKLHGRWTSSRRHDVLAWIADRLCPDLRASCLKGHIPRADRLQLQHLWSLDGSALKLRQDELRTREAQERAHYEAWLADAAASSDRRARASLLACGLHAEADQQTELDDDGTRPITEDESAAMFSAWAANGEAFELDEGHLLTIDARAHADMAPARAAGGGW